MDEPAVVEESKVLEPKYFCTAFLLLRDLDIRAWTHGKEECKDGELQGGTL